MAEEHNPSTDGTLRVPSTYLEIVAMKAGSTASPNLRDESRVAVAEITIQPGAQFPGTPTGGP